MEQKTAIPIRQLFLSYMAQTSDSPLMLEFVKAKGIYMYAPNGKKYIDLISGIGVSNVGHCHPKVVRAVTKQAQKYMHLMVYGEYVQSPQVKLAKAISETLPPHLDNVYFTNSGSEAIEGAIKLAKRYTGRTEIISAKNAYHGSTHGALSLSGNETFKTAYRPLLPDIRHIQFNQESDLDFITQKTAAVVLETLQGEAGVVVPKNDYLKKVHEKCQQTGTLLILDEVQTGFGRTGKFWAFEHFGIEPDMLVCAKGMGGGMPIGAFVASQTLMEVFKNNPILGHITTFGGHPVSCAASYAALRAIQSENLTKKARQGEQLFRENLQHHAIKNIRGMGLMLAVEFESFDILKKIIDTAIEMGVVTDWFLYCDNAMRIAPPLIIDKVQIEKACRIILKAIDSVVSEQK